MITNLSVFVAEVSVSVHPLNKDFSQSVIGTFCQCHFLKDGRMGRFCGFSSLFAEVNRLKCDGQCSFFLS